MWIHDESVFQHDSGKPETIFVICGNWTEVWFTLLETYLCPSPTPKHTHKAAAILMYTRIATQA